MSTPDSGDSKRVLYLEQIDIETGVRTKLHIQLQNNNNDVEIERKNGTSSWIPSRSLELADSSEIVISAQTNENLFETLAEVNGGEAMQAFWDSKDSVSRPTTFDQQPATVTFHFRPSHTSETIRVAVENLQTAMKDYKSPMIESTHQRTDTVVKFGAVIAEACHVLLILSVSYTLQMDPFATLAFGLVTCTFALLKEQRKYDENVSELASRINGLLPFAERPLEGVVYEEELLDGVVMRLYDLIADAANFIVGYVQRGPASRELAAAISSKDHAKITALQGDFSKLRADFDGAVDVAVLTLVRRNEESDLLKRLRPVEAAIYDEDRSCMEGTRTAILSDIIDWALQPLDGDSQSNGSNLNVFWLYGMPGLGKTSVANSLCGYLHRKNNLGGTFFCKSDNVDLRDPTRMLPTLISNLVRIWGPFRKQVAKVLLDEPQINPKSTRGELLLKALQLLKKHPRHPLVLVIDAMDECGQPSSRGPLLSCLTQASSLVNWLKIVVTSRPERDIKAFFDSRNVTSRDFTTDDLNGEDIRLFTEIRMYSIARDRHLPYDWPGQERISQIVERAHGLFIFVNTLFRLVDVPNPEPVLVGVLSGKVEGANTELHKLYSTAITSRSVRHTEEFNSILRAVIAVSAYRPLCAETLAELMDLGVPTILSYVDELSSLLYRDRDQENAIRVRHLSVLEFFVGPTCPQEFRVDLRLADSEVARYCLGTMARKLKFNICELETSCVSNPEIQDLNGRVEQRIPDALQYSCIYWSNHLCHDVDPVGAETTGLLDSFFAESQPLYWLEVLSLMGKVPVAILALQLMKECFKKFEDRHQHLIEDVLRFVVAFFTPISTSAPHIYISGLSFMPMESNLWTRVSGSFPESMNVCKGRIKSWPGPPSKWRGHASAVQSVAYSPDGQVVVSGSDDNSIRIWDAQTGAAVGEPLTGHTDTVSSIAYSPDGRNIASGSWDNTIRIWDAQTGAAVGEPVMGHTSDVSSVAYSPDGRNIISGSRDYTIRIWDAQTGAPVGEPLTGHTGSVWSVAYSPDGRNIVSGSYDDTVRIWDAQTGALMGQPLTGHTSAVLSVAYSPDGRNVVSGSWDKTIRVWDAQTGAAVGEPLMGHTREVSSVVYSPDGRNVISGSGDSTVRVWNAETGAAVGEPLTGHVRYVSSVAHSPYGRNVVSGSYDDTLRIWETPTGAPVGKPLTGHTSTILNVAYSPDGKNVVSGSQDNTIRIWDAQTGEPVGKPLTGHTSHVESVAYSPDGRNIISGSRDHTIRIWNTQTGAVVGEPLTGHTKGVLSVTCSPDGRNVVSGSDDNTIRIWDTQTGAPVGKPLTGHTSRVSSVAYSPDGKNIVSGSWDYTIRIWNAQTGEPVGEPLTGHTSYVESVAYSPDSRSITSGSRDHTIRIWNAQTSAPVGRQLRGHAYHVSSVAYSPDGLNIVSGSWDKTIRIWDAQTGAPVGESLRGHADFVVTVAYSPDSRNVVAGSDHTIRIWDVQAGLGEGDSIPRTFKKNAILFLADGHGAFHDSTNHPNNPFTLDSFSGCPIPETLLSSDGWVRNADGLLFWVPEDCRYGLTCPVVMNIPNTGRQRCIRIDFSRFRYGTLWTNIRGGGRGGEL